MLQPIDLPVVNFLNKAIQSETEGIVFYVTHASVQATNWGLDKLAAATMARAKQEMEHLDRFTDRLAELGGTLDAERKIRPIQVGAGPLDQIKIALGLESEALQMYNEAVAACEACGDNNTRALFEDILGDEVQHHLYAQQQIEQASLMTESNWISTLG